MRHLYQGTMKDGNGRVIGSKTTSDGVAGTCSVYLAGTTTAASIYEAESGGSAVNSVTTGEYGHFYFWVDPKDYPVTQRFKIVLSHSDFESKTYDDLTIILYPDVEARYIVDATETDQGAAGDGYSLKDLIDEIGTSEQATIFFTHSSTGNTTIYTLTTSETVPSNIRLIKENGAIIDGAGILTVNGPFEVGLYQVFGSSITVVFGNGAVTEVYPEWWGENTTPGTTDMTTEIQAAMDSGGDKVRFSNITYLVGTLTPPTQIHLRGSHQTRTILKLAAGTDGHLLDCNTCVWLNISDLTLDGNKANNAATSNGIDMATSHSCTIERVRIKDFNDYGVYLDTCNAIVFDCCWIEKNQFGFYATSSEQCNLDKCIIQENTTYGVQYVSALVGAISIVNGCWFENQGETPTDYIIVDSDNLHISSNKFNVTGCSNSAIRVKTGAKHNYFLSNAFHNTDPTYFIVFDSGAEWNFSISNGGGSGGIAGGPTTDNDGGNYILEYDSTGIGATKQAGRIYHHIITLDNTGTPSVKMGNYFITGGTTAITAFDDGENGQVITIIARHTITITDGAALILNGSANFDMFATDTLTLIMDNVKWKEIARSDNS